MANLKRYLKFKTYAFNFHKRVKTLPPHTLAVIAFGFFINHIHDLRCYKDLQLQQVTNQSITLR